MPSWLQDFVGVLSALAQLGIAAGLALTWWEVRSDHERSRRQTAIDLMVRWSNSTEPESEAARRLGDVLDFEQSRAVQLHRSFELDAKHEDLLRHVARGKIEKRADKIIVSSAQSSAIRYYIVRYLNGLEGVLAAWRHNVADREMIDEQFRGFVSHENREFILENYRLAAKSKIA